MMQQEVRAARLSLVGIGSALASYYESGTQKAKKRRILRDHSTFPFSSSTALVKQLEVGCATLAYSSRSERWPLRLWSPLPDISAYAERISGSSMAASQEFTGYQRKPLSPSAFSW